MATVTPQTRQQNQQDNTKHVTPTSIAKPTTKQFGGLLFAKENYKWMAIAGALIILGFILMAGGKSVDPTQFKPEEVYSTMRITIAPILVLAGLCVMVYAILKNPKSANTNS